MAVARAWTLAYGVMLGVEWPDAIPESFAGKFGVSRLRDSVAPEVPQHVMRDGRRYAEERVAEVREKVFALHGLGG